MAADSVAAATRQRILSSNLTRSYGTNPSEPSSGYITVTSSWASTHGLSSLGLGPDRPPLAWVGVRHQVNDQDKAGDATIVGDRSTSHCNQAVLLTCLHLSHEMGLREVGLYGWTLPNVKDPAGSMLRIMKRYATQLRELSAHPNLNCRTVPDPSKASIQHHLQKARLAAGSDSYVTVLYAGHGIQEPPTEAGELWCYDRSFEECAQQGGGPSEYIPILLFDLLTWAGSSTCYVWDCQHAGRFIRAAITEAEEIDSQLRAAAAQNPSVASLHPAVYAKRQIHFAACGAHQLLPRVPGMPDDLFTACLTTPLRIALLYHNLQTFPLTKSDSGKYIQRSAGYMAALIESMSQDLKDRLWSELQAILHTIAWQSLSGADYQMLFGQSGDVISNIAGGFLLSQRVMGTYRANPESIPAISTSNAHPLWTHWDLILDNLFEQLPPYFDEDKKQWEDELKLVSFMDDQLASILESDQPLFAADVSRPGVTAGLSRLPIICKAALTPEFRHRACTALDTCLRNLDVRGLAHAVQGGALDVAGQLLALEDPSIAPEIISIWSSLVRHDACVMSLAADGRTAERLTSVPCVKFFLDALEKYLGYVSAGSTRMIIQTAAVLSTIANFVAGRQAPRFVARTLSVASEMLNTEDGLVKQWGALLIAEVMGSINRATEDNERLIEKLKLQVLEMINSPSVETRATAVYALTRWIGVTPVENLDELASSLDLIAKVGPYCQRDGSGLVRKEIIRLLQRALLAGGKWTVFALWAFMLDRAAKGQPSEKEACDGAIDEVSDMIGFSPDAKKGLIRLQAIIRVYNILRLDPNARVASLVKDNLKAVFGEILPYLDGEHFDGMYQTVFPADSGGGEWTVELVDAVKQVGLRLTENWAKPVDRGPSRNTKNEELFERSKLSLQIYLLKETPEEKTEQVGDPIENTQERSVTIRYRTLEDSFVVAQQQIGLPWKWAMKDITSPDPWSTITCHSFLNTVMSCNNSQDLLMWNWSSSRKTGSVHLDLPPGAIITAARFVNELHQRIVVLAEINNGDIHVLSAPSDDPTRMKTISSFLGLNLQKDRMPVEDPDHDRLVTTWWRQNGNLCVGGPSSVVNVWDCPAERCCRVLQTESNVALTTLITEPVSGNIIIGGFANGQVKLWDLRQSRTTSLISWQGDTHVEPGVKVSSGRAIAKVGVVLGESKHITSACTNGVLNIHDLRNLVQPTSSILAHRSGIASASFQAHSGLMSTISNLDPAPIPSKPALPTDLDLSHLSLSPSRPRVNFGLHRSSTSMLDRVTEETVYFYEQSFDVGQKGFKPFTVMHNLRPFLGIGYGRSCFLRGSGVGKGDDTDSGSYSFLTAQSQRR